MMTVYKYKLELRVGIPQTISVTGYKDFLCAMSIGNDVVVYAGVDTDDTEKTEIELMITGTGVPFESMKSYEYIGSVQTHKGVYVWHVFYKL